MQYCSICRKFVRKGIKSPDSLQVIPHKTFCILLHVCTEKPRTDGSHQLVVQCIVTGKYQMSHRTVTLTYLHPSCAHLGNYPTYEITLAYLIRLWLQTPGTTYLVRGNNPETKHIFHSSWQESGIHWTIPGVPWALQYVSLSICAIQQNNTNSVTQILTQN